MVMSKSQHYCPYITFFTGNKSLKGLVVQHCLYDTLTLKCFSNQATHGYRKNPLRTEMKGFNGN